MDKAYQDVFCSCVGGNRVPDVDCGEVLCKREPLPEVFLSVSGDVARASGQWCNLQWRIYVEKEDDKSARSVIRVAKSPDERASHVADVTIHAPYDVNLIDEVQDISAAILWSRFRAGWLEDAR